MNRHLHSWLPHASARNIRLWALLAVLGTIGQLRDPLVDASVSEALVFWGGRMLTLAACLWLSDNLVTRYLGERMASPPWLKSVLIVTAVALLPCAVIELILESQVALRAPYKDDELMAISPVLAYLGEYATLMSVILPIHFLLWLLVNASVVKATPNVQATPESVLVDPEFLGKTKGVGVTDVLALQAEEHYVRVHTDAGSELIHHRFGDAMSLMPDTLGLQVHRSWWIADRAVASAQRGARRWTLNLSDDLSVPVSDRHVARVRERGLLKRH